MEESVNKELFKTIKSPSGPQEQLAVSRFKARFQAELQKGFQEAKEDLRRRQK